MTTTAGQLLIQWTEALPRQAEVIEGQLETYAALISAIDHLPREEFEQFAEQLPPLLQRHVRLAEQLTARMREMRGKVTRRRARLG